MMPVNNDRQINQKLKQFEVALQKTKNSDNESYLEWVIQKLGSINNQIATTACLELCYPEWIGFTELHIAFSTYNLKAFRLLLSHGADYTLKNQSGLTVLHSITKFKSWVRPKFADSFVTAVLSAHIEQKQNVNPHDPNGLSHFHAACMTDNVEGVEFFLKNSVSIYEQVNENSSYFAGYTPLHFAVRYFSFQVVEILLKHGANRKLKDAEGMTPMQVLLKSNFEMINRNKDSQSSIQQERALSEKIARLLLKNDNSKDTMMIDDSGLSCLHIASALMDLLAVEQLLEKVVDVNHCVNLESSLWAGYTALHFAAFFDVNIVKLLVRRGADLQAKDAKGVTPLDLCLERYKVKDIHSIFSQKEEWKDITFSDGKTKLLDLIAAMTSYEHFKKFLRRVTKNKVITLPDDSPLWPGFTPMHLAVILAKRNFCTDKNNINIINMQHTAVDKTYLEIISALYEKNEKMIETQDNYGCTPLHLCFRSGMVKEMANFLMTLYQKLTNPPDLIDEDNLSHLHIACTYNNDNLVQKLLLHSNNSNLAYTGKQIKELILRGWTPLHLAVIQRQCNRRSYSEMKNRNVVEILLRHDANINVKDSQGLTPVHLLVFPNYFGRYALRNSIDDMLLSSPHLEMDVVGDNGLSYLHVACSQGKEELVKKLIHAGADVNGSIKFIPKTYCDFSLWYTNIIKYYVNNTPLQVASFTSRGRELIGFIIERGADIFAKNSKGLPLLYEVLEIKNSRENPNVDKLNIFATILMGNKNLKMKAEKDIGLTMLHVACRMKNRILVKNLLDNGANVNAQISLTSPIWPGYTPLHALMHYIDNHNDDWDADYILELLLIKGAEVTLENDRRQTSLHMAYNNYIEHLHEVEYNKAILKRATSMITALKDFSINPTSIEGITHFHIACSLADIFSVKKFLDHGHIDIDQPIDFFEMSYFSDCSPIAGYTPLHLAVMNGNRHWKSVIDSIESTFPLEIVNLLLEHGANVNAENAWGETPFHIADRFELLQRLARGGANVNAKNAVGQTPLEVFLSRESSGRVIDLLRCGCHYNTFNPETGIGCIGLTMRSLNMLEMQKLVTMAMINFPELMVDEMGRTVIHNLVSIYDSNVSSEVYAGVIEHLSKMRCDVDAQDKLGRTALHTAVKFKNLKAISGLLLAGADINITDVNGQTPLAHQFQPCSRCDKPTDVEAELCEHYKVFELLALHVKKLQYCRLDVHRLNEEIVATAFPNFTEVNVNSRFIIELNHLKGKKIKSYSLTLHDFMSELDAVADYSTMLKIKSNMIDRYLLSGEVCRQLREKFCEVAGLLKLQYRKAVKRTDLLQEAKVSLMDFLACTRVPELCSRIILRFLTNSELESMVNACESVKKNMSR